MGVIADKLDQIRDDIIDLREEHQETHNFINRDLIDIENLIEMLYDKIIMSEEDILEEEE